MKKNLKKKKNKTDANGYLSHTTPCTCVKCINIYADAWSEFGSKDIYQLFKIISKSTLWYPFAFWFLGYSPEHIANFELWANQDRGPPARYFMSEWSQTEHATVGALLRVLRTLGREDIVRVLQTDLLPREPRVLPSNQEPLLV